MAAGCPASFPTYSDFVAVYLNLEYVRARRITDTADAVRIALGDATTPDAWVDMLSRSPAEASAWRRQEFQKSRER